MFGAPYKLPTSEVTHLESETLSSGKTIGLVAGIALITAIVVKSATCRKNSVGFCS